MSESEGVDAAPERNTRAACEGETECSQARERWLMYRELLLGIGLGIALAWLRLIGKIGRGHGLIRSPLAWMYVLLAGGLTSLTYMMGFSWFKQDTDSMRFLLGTAGAGPIFGNALLIAIGRFVPSSKAEQLETGSLRESLEKSTDILVDLIRSSMEESRQRKVNDLAERYSDLGEIKSSARVLVDAAVYAGHSTPEDRDRALGGILPLEATDDERTSFNNRRLAIERATRLIEPDRLGAHLAMSKWDRKERRRGADRRARQKENGWEGSERRSGWERRGRVRL